MKPLIIVLLAAWFFSGLDAQARILTGYTPEWISHDADLIVEASVVSGSVTFYAGDTFFTRVRVRVSKVIKGPVSDEDEVTIWAYREKDPMGLSKPENVGRRLLIFAKVAENTFPELDGRYVFLSHRFGQLEAYDLGAPVKFMYNEDGSRISDFATLAERVQKQVSKEYELRRAFWKGTIEMKKIEAPHLSDASRDLPGLSGTIIIAPDYKEP